MADKLLVYLGTGRHRLTVTADICVLALLLTLLLLRVRPSGHMLTAALTYHFLHANIFHLAANVYAIALFRPRLRTCAVAYVSASLAYVITAALAAHIHVLSPLIPSVGLSGFVFAAWARKYASWRWPVWRPLASGILLAFLPGFNWLIHILSFIISYLIWRLSLRHGTAAR